MCRACRLAPPPFVRAVAYGPYEHRMRDAIHALKYDRFYPLSRNLGRMLAEAIGQLAAEAPAEMLVIPVPLHQARHAERGFNQARLLACCAIDIVRKTHPGWRLTLAPAAVVRHRRTDSQASLTPRQRRANVRGAFRVADAAAIAGRNILLIDDIFTTGATMRAIAKELSGEGAASVWVATLARARWLNEGLRNRQIRYDRGYDSPSFEDTNHRPDAPQAAPGGRTEHAGMHSSTHQPSF